MVLVLEETASSTSTANAEYEYEYEKARETSTAAPNHSNCATSKLAPQAHEYKPHTIGVRYHFVHDFVWYEFVDLHCASSRSDFAERVLVDDLPIDGIVHKLA
jgi:hypothetical protein